MMLLVMNFTALMSFLSAATCCRTAKDTSEIYPEREDRASSGRCGRGDEVVTDLIRGECVQRMGYHGYFLVQ